MKPLKVVCYSDGRPGHEKQSRSVLVALKALTPLSVTMQTLAETAGIKRAIQGIKGLLGTGNQFGASLLPAIDLIIGTGSTTHLPMVGLKLRSGARTVTCMAPDPWLRPWFDLCLVPRHDRPPAGSRYFPTMGPPCLALNSDRHDSAKGLIVAGGIDNKSHRWNTAELISQLEQLIARSPDVTWTLSSSPRTPPDAVDLMQNLADDSVNVHFYSADQTPKGWIEAAYETHAQVWVTADSVSMIYEALTAGCRVGVLPVAWKRPQNKFQNGIEELQTQGLILEYKQWIHGYTHQPMIRSFNESARCAEEILSRWWPDRWTG
jgi:mitochondrial fission protein ELM1